MSTILVDNLVVNQRVALPIDSQSDQSFLNELWQQYKYDKYGNGLITYNEGYQTKIARQGEFKAAVGGANAPILVQAFVPLEGGPFPVVYHFDFTGLTFLYFYCDSRLFHSVTLDDYTKDDGTRTYQNEGSFIIAPYKPISSERGKMCLFRVHVGSANPNTFGRAHTNGYLEVM